MVYLGPKRVRVLVAGESGVLGRKSTESFPIYWTHDRRKVYAGRNDIYYEPSWVCEGYGFYGGEPFRQ